MLKNKNLYKDPTESFNDSNELEQIIHSLKNANIMAVEVIHNLKVAVEDNKKEIADLKTKYNSFVENINLPNEKILYSHEKFCSLEKITDTHKESLDDISSKIDQLTNTSIVIIDNKIKDIETSINSLANSNSSNVQNFELKLTQNKADILSDVKNSILEITPIISNLNNKIEVISNDVLKLKEDFTSSSENFIKLYKTLDIH